MRVLLTGGSGQLGQALQAHLPEGVHLAAPTRQQLDLADPNSCRRAIRQHRPDWVINAGAYTAVDRAEIEPTLVHAVNSEAPAAFVDALTLTGGRLLQLSTDFVFSGSQGSPYRTDDQTNPLGVYGASKASAERAVLRWGGAVVLRTSWVYGPVGHNFCQTMLRLLAEREQVGVVVDQISCPTSTLGLAHVCWSLLMKDAAGIKLPNVLHWSDAGVASWYDFATAIGEIAVEEGVLRSSAPIMPIASSAYPTPARRPCYSLLESAPTAQLLGLQRRHWRSALREVLQTHRLKQRQMEHL